MQRAICGVVLALACVSLAAEPIQPLQVQGEDFVDPAGQTVKFWGVNTVALYPAHEVADKLAANLASLQVNLVRPHHMLRPSGDWVLKGAPILALQDYRSGSTRKPDPEAWDRFDYLNSALRNNGIYLMLSVWWSRNYLPDDVDVVKTDDADRKAWIDAIGELNGWPWKQSRDPRKMLCTIDERTAALEEEFARQLLTHVNPYTRLSYAQDPQVLTLELQNECSSDYILVCKNKFPEYFQRKLVAKWETFAREGGIDPGDLYKPANAKAVAVRGAFFRKLDEDYLKRMKTVIQESGSKASVAFSNLWEGENAQEMYAQNNGHIEDHCYWDPFAAGKAEDFVYQLIKSPVLGKPYFVGELNAAESLKLLQVQSPVRTQLPLAAAAYGSLQNWSAIVYFAWLHGDKHLGADGWAEREERDVLPPAGNDYLRNEGAMITDGMQMDHLRTCGIMFRQGLLGKSISPITLHVDDPVVVADYAGLMRGKYVIKPGWQDVHAIRKAYGAVPDGQANAPWLKESPANPLVSDTKQITKDIERKQLTIAAPKAEAFSGYLDGRAPAAMKHLSLAGEGFATVVLVAQDGVELANSVHLILSRTNIGADNKELDGPVIHLAGLRAPAAGQHWQIRPTRPRDIAGGAPQDVKYEDGQLVLTAGPWHECELELK